MFSAKSREDEDGRSCRENSAAHNDNPAGTDGMAFVGFEAIGRDQIERAMVAAQ
jgi:hypothetical protein